MSVTYGGDARLYRSRGRSTSGLNALGVLVLAVVAALVGRLLSGPPAPNSGLGLLALGGLILGGLLGALLAARRARAWAVIQIPLIFLGLALGCAATAPAGSSHLGTAFFVLAVDAPWIWLATGAAVLIAVVRGRR